MNQPQSIPTLYTYWAKPSSRTPESVALAAQLFSLVIIAPVDRVIPDAGGRTALLSASLASLILPGPFPRTVTEPGMILPSLHSIYVYQPTIQSVTAGAQAQVSLASLVQPAPQSRTLSQDASASVSLNSIIL